jgi:OTU-like cysteine protease
MTRSSFFSTPVIPAEQPEPKLVVNVGGAGDCGFRAAAAAMIDNILTKPRANQELAKKLLALHDKYFHEDHRKRAARLFKPSEQIVALTETPTKRALFLSQLAWVLRQVAVDYQVHPDHQERYIGAFIKENEGTEPQKMRQQETWIDESAIDALARAMDLKIEVKVVEPGNELFSRSSLSYDPSSTEKPASSSPIVLQLQNKHYMPLVNNPPYFEGMKPVPVNPIATNEKDPELAEILANVAAAEQRLLDEYNKTIKRLTAMVNARELTKADLLDIYIKGMDTSDYLTGRIKYAGIEHGHQHFFEAIKNARYGLAPVVLSKESHEKQVTDALIQAISRAISVKQLDPALVYGEELKVQYKR